jgi:hypothetical protein
VRELGGCSRVALCALIVSLMTLNTGGCKVARDAKQIEAERDVAKLEKIVRLPIRPLEVWFRSVPRGANGGLGPTDWTFLAVMRFDPAALTEFVNSGQLVEKGEPRFPKNEVAPWLPSQVTAALQPGTGTHLRIKGRRFDAAPFARESSGAGSLFFLDDVPFVVLRRPQE